MKTRLLGGQGLAVSALGLGCMGMSQDYGPADEADSIRTIRHALDLGITLIDTSMSYGAGENERLVGRALAGRRDEVVLATKFGIVRDRPGDPARLCARPDDIRRYCDASLARLGTDRIDLYYLHRVDPQVPIEDSVGTMAELVAAGKVRYLGISETDPAELERAAAVHPISAVQYEWSLSWRELEDDIVPLARKLGIGVVAFSPLGRGFLTGALDLDSLGPDDDRLPDQRFHGEHLARNTDRLRQLSGLAADRGITPGQLALAWLLHQGEDVVPIPGTRSRDRLAENAAATDIDLSAEDLAEIETTLARSSWSGSRHSFAVPRTDRRGDTD
ncbi:aldo/keto reductase [Nocardia terpenica]|uniref:Aldo/keto reductase n=1 Tax=Nocardia terpenica TaxID=455432 RepID=A0A164N1A9_9NOCA|nr:aldo/keto reductase [Nocardia terpenica]KZM73877.1 aldo/keto reductase [Nocardia terpenica]NQE86838.1 aldo/keto reductase [Nocardia terpenica]